MIARILKFKSTYPLFYSFYLDLSNAVRFSAGKQSKKKVRVQGMVGYIMQAPTAVVCIGDPSF